MGDLQRAACQPLSGLSEVGMQGGKFACGLIFSIKLMKGDSQPA